MVLLFMSFQLQVFVYLFTYYYFVAGMTRRFVSAKRLIRYFSNSSKLVEHRAQSPDREVKMLAVWPSMTDGFPTANGTLSAMLNEFAGIRKVSDESLGRDETPRHTSHEI